MAAEGCPPPHTCMWCSWKDEVEARVTAAEATAKEALLRLEQLLADQSEGARFRAAISKETEQLAMSVEKGARECSRSCNLVEECSRRVDDVAKQLGELDRVVAAHREEAGTRLDGVSDALQKRVGALDRLVAESQREAEGQRLASGSQSQAGEEAAAALEKALEERLEAALGEATAQLGRQADQGALRVSKVAEAAAEVSAKRGLEVAHLGEDAKRNAAAAAAAAAAATEAQAAAAQALAYYRSKGKETRSVLSDTLRLRQDISQKLEESVASAVGEARERLSSALAEQHGVVFAARAELEGLLAAWKGGLSDVKELLAMASQNRLLERHLDLAEEHARVVTAVKRASGRVAEVHVMNGKEEGSVADSASEQAWTVDYRRQFGSPFAKPPAGRSAAGAKSMGPRLQRASSASALHQTPPAMHQTPPARVRQGLAPNWT